MKSPTSKARGQHIQGTLQVAEALSGCCQMQVR